MKRIPKNVNNILFGFFLVLSVTLFARSVQSPYQDVRFDDENVTFFNEAWKVVEPNREGIISLPVNLPLKENEVLELSKNLPDSLEEGSFLCLRSVHQEIRVSVNHKIIYSYGENKEERFGKSPSNAWNLIPLPDDAAGSTLTIEVISPYKAYAGNMGDVLLGSHSALLFQLVRSYVPSLLIDVSIASLGLSLIAVYVFVARKNKVGKSLLYLGVFSLLVSIWLISESKITQLLFGNQLMILPLAFISLVSFPIAGLKYLNSIENYAYRRFQKTLEKILYVQATLVLLLQFFGIYDFMVVLPYLQIGLCVIPSLFFGSILLDLLKNKNKRIWKTFFALLMMLAFAMLELLQIFVSQGRAAGGFLQIGFMVFVILQAIPNLRKVQEMLVLSRDAWKDLLTGCQNRTAYIRRLEGLRGKEKGIGILAIDLNDLKQVNDTQGHWYGDAAIIACADCIFEVCRQGDVAYRVGGDEFLILKTDTSLSELCELEKELLRVSAQKDEECSFEFSLAIGHAIFEPEVDTSIIDTVNRADFLMYQHKNHFHEWKVSGNETLTEGI